jgi:hypothetical protein
MTESDGERPRGSSTICLPFQQEAYEQFIDDPDAFRAAVDQAFSDIPELFPCGFADGYTLKDLYTSNRRVCVCAASSAGPRGIPLPSAPLSSCPT